MIASAQNSVPSLAEYNMHCIRSFRVRWGRSTMPLDEEESAAVVLISYPLELATLRRSCDPESSPPPSVVIEALTWSGRRLGSRSVK